MALPPDLAVHAVAGFDKWCDVFPAEMSDGAFARFVCRRQDGAIRDEQELAILQCRRRAMDRAVRFIGIVAGPQDAAAELKPAGEDKGMRRREMPMRRRDESLFPLVKCHPRPF